MDNTVTHYRPIGLAEARLIEASGCTAFPPPRVAETGRMVAGV